MLNRDKRAGPSVIDEVIEVVMGPVFDRGNYLNPDSRRTPTPRSQRHSAECTSVHYRLIEPIISRSFAVARSWPCANICFHSKILCVSATPVEEDTKMLNNNRARYAKSCEQPQSILSINSTGDLANEDLRRCKSHPRHKTSER